MFNDLVGNTEVKKYLEKTIELDNASHSYMFVGKSGIGKRLFAREFAKKLLCLDKENCNGSCDSCIKFDAGTHTDFYEVEPDGNMIKISQIRSLLEKISVKPVTSSKKVYIINDADKMNQESQNSLLKTLEEPAEYVTIILIVENENIILPTIKSRCIKVSFNKLKQEDIKQINPKISDELIEILDGSMSNISTISENIVDYEAIKALIGEIKNKPLQEFLKGADVLYNGKDNINSFLEYMNILFFKNGMIDAIEYVEKTKQKLLMNNNYEMSIDYLLMNTWKSVH